MFAMVQTSLDDLKKVSKTRTLRVGWVQCCIDTKTHITRCPKCGLLGHSALKCNHMDDQTTAEPTTEAIRQDCSHHDKLLEEAGKASGAKM